MSAFAVLLLGLSYVSEHSELIAFVELGRRPEELQRKDTDPVQLGLYTRTWPCIHLKSILCSRTKVLISKRSNEIKTPFHANKHWTRWHIRVWTRSADGLGLLTRARQDTHWKEKVGWGIRSLGLCWPFPRARRLLSVRVHMYWVLPVQILTKSRPAGSLIEQWLPKCASDAPGVPEQLWPRRQLVGSYLIQVCSRHRNWQIL